MDGAATRARIGAERDVALAHTTAQFMRAKKLESLDRYLPRRDGGGGSMLDRLKSIAAATEGLG